MNDIVQFDLTDITPDKNNVLENLGYTKDKTGSERILDLFMYAMDEFIKSVQALGMIHNLPKEEF